MPELKAVIKMVEKAPWKALDLLGPTVKAGRAVRLTAPCSTHGCSCMLLPAKTHIAGTNCTDFSAFGSGQRTSGITMLYLLAWIALRLALMEPLVIQENVDSFAWQLLVEYLGDHYYVDPDALEDSYNFGMPTHRIRRWTVLRHRVKIISEISPLSSWFKMFHRVCMLTWADFMQAPDLAELEAELQWASSRASVVEQREQTGNTERITIDSEDAFKKCMTKWELHNLEGYLKLWPNRAYSLGQSAESSFACKSCPTLSEVEISRPAETIRSVSEQLSQRIYVLSRPKRNDTIFLCSPVGAN